MEFRPFKGGGIRVPGVVEVPPNGEVESVEIDALNCVQLQQRFQAQINIGWFVIHAAGLPHHFGFGKGHVSWTPWKVRLVGPDPYIEWVLADDDPCWKIHQDDDLIHHLGWLRTVLYELAAAGRIRRRNGVEEREMVRQTLKIFFNLFIFCLDVSVIGYEYSEGSADAAEALTSFAFCATRFFAELTLSIWAGFLPQARTSEAMFALSIVTGLVFFTRAVFLLARGFWSFSFIVGVNSLIWFSRVRQAAPGHAHQM